MSQARREPLARLTQAELNRYRSEVDKAADAAGSYVLDAMEAFLRVYPDADTAAMRNFVVEVLQVSLPNFCDAAATLSADLFDEIAEALGVEADTRLYDTIDYDRVEQKVRYFAKFLNEGDAEKFKKKVVDVTRYYVKRSAFDNMRENCKGQKIKWARVPTGFETCPFCFMLASRGFVYGNEKKAIVDHKTGDKYHVHCDCIAIPGFEDDEGNPRVKIDGYDPQAMYENWCKCAQTVGIDPQRKKTAWTDEERKAVMDEVATRDWHWLYTKEKPKTTFETPKLEARLNGKRNRHELRTGERLAENGIPPQWQVDERRYYDENKRLWQRVGLPDLRNGYEVKTPQDSGWSSIDGYLRDVKKKEGVRAVVIDNFENRNPMTDDELIEKLRKQRRWGGPLYLITRNNEYIRVK